MTNGFPWGGLAFPQVEWRAGMGEVLGEGVVADRTGTAIASAAGTDTEVDVRAHRAMVQGVQDDFSAVSIDVAAFGANPTGGQTRIDYVCWKYDPTAKTLTITCVPGSPATTGSAVPPTLTRSTTGPWYAPIARVTRVGTAAVQSSGVSRAHAWLGPFCGNFVTESMLPSNAPQGSSAWVGDDLWQRKWNGSALVWQNETNPPWLGLGVSVTATGAADYRYVSGGVQFRGERTCLSFPGGVVQNFPTGSLTTVGTIGSVHPAEDRHIGGVRFLTASYGGGFMDIDTDGVVKVRPEAGAAAQTVSFDGLWVPL